MQIEAKANKEEKQTVSVGASSCINKIVSYSNIRIAAEMSLQHLAQSINYIIIFAPLSMPQI